MFGSRALLALLFAISLTAQDAPASEPEPRRKLSADPDTLLPRLLSRNRAERDAALKSLGMEFIAERAPDDIRLFAVNLDSDPELERVLIITAASDVEETVLKRDNDGWWELGQFVCCGPGSRLNDPFVELRQTVSYGTQEIIVHAGGKSGTGVAERRLMIYRVRQGELYNVLDIVESAYNLSGSGDTRVSYPDTDSRDSAMVIKVHRTKEVNGRRRTTCELYQWNAEKFAFLRIAPEPRLCAQH